MFQDRPVLVVDAMNLFVRSYCAYPTVSSHGYQMGGAIGFLKTLRRIVSDIQPKAIYVVWESGGSPRRRALFKEYKMNRRPERLNRFYEDDIPDTDENRVHQNIALLAFLRCAPVCQVYVPDCEGDDVIAYLCKGPFSQETKVIASSDKDMYQLVDERTTIYNLHKKTYVTEADVLKEFRVLPENFALAKALCGDRSDNIPGVPGYGFRTCAKTLPLLSSTKGVILQDVKSYCQAHRDVSKPLNRVLEHWGEVERNWRLVYLGTSSLTASQVVKVQSAISTFEPVSDRMGLIRSLIKEGISDFDVEGFFYAFNCVPGLKQAASAAASG